MAAVKGFRELRVWQAGMDLVEQVYHLSRTFPRTEVYGLASQMQRAAVSIPSNIAEGHARSYTREYIHHISIAQGSLAELQTQVEIAVRLGFCATDHVVPISEQSTSLSKLLQALRRALERGGEQ